MKQFVKNWSYLVVSDVVTKVFGFFATILLARTLNPAGYGNYNVILAVAAIFTILANFGMTQVITREIARRTEISGNLFFRVLSIRFISSLLAVLGIVTYFLLLEPQVDEIIVIFTCIITISITAWDLAESVAFGRQIMKYSAIINSIASFVWIASLFLLPKNYFSIFNVLLIFVVIDVLKAGAYFILLKRNKLIIKIESDLVPTYKNIIGMSIPYLWLWGMGIFSNQVQILFLAQNSNAEEVGYFSIGLRLMIPLMMVTSTAMKAVFPNLSKLYKDNIDKFQKVISDGLILIMFFGTIIAALLTLTSKYFIPFLFGESYLNSVMPFNFLIWYIIIYSVAVLLGASLSASDRQITLAILGTIDFIIAIPLLYWGSLHGAFYLALAKLGTGIILIFYHWLIFKNILGKRFSIFTWIYIMLFWVSLMCVSILFETFSINLQLLLFIFILIVFYIFPKSPFQNIPMIIRGLIIQK